MIRGTLFHLVDEIQSQGNPNAKLAKRPEKMGGKVK
jgi:hypothetical protein